MAVVIEEMVTETAEEPTRASTPGASGGGELGEPDLDRLDYQIMRRRHRAERLWAD